MLMIPMIRRDEHGQSLVEFAIVAPLVFLLLFGIIQLGFLFAGQNGLTSAAREAARYASTLPTPDSTAAGTCAQAASNTGRVYDRLKTVSLPQYVPGYQQANLISGSTGNCSTWAINGSGTGVIYCLRSNGDGTNSVRVRVRVVYDHPLFIPLVGRLFSTTNQWRLGAVEEMRVEGPNRLASQSGGITPCP